jgi:uncharacterized protein with GYD domain
MATYVTLYTFTDQGLKTIKDTVKRAEAVKKAAAAAGVTLSHPLIFHTSENVFTKALF